MKFDIESQQWKREWHEEDTGELVFSFQNIVPMPDEKNKDEDWYQWRLKLVMKILKLLRSK
jgi:hypothetical protein